MYFKKSNEILKKIVFIFILGIISNILIRDIFCQTNNNSNTNQNRCNQGKPTDFDSCKNRGTSNNFSRCCYLEDFNDLTNRLCLEIPEISYNGGPLYNLEDTLYRIQCPNFTKKNSLNTCGESINPISKDDCSVFSSFTVSCCYDYDDKKCYSLGAKYSGTTKWGGKSLNCFSNLIGISFVSKVFFAILIGLII